MPSNTRSRPTPYKNDEFDILVGTFDGDRPGDEDDTTYGFDDKNDPSFDGTDVLSYNFQGGDGNDEFFGGSNDDTLKGGKGLDALYGGDGRDWIYGGADTDWLFGDGGQDHLFGEDGSDQLYGGANSDVLYGGELSDWLDGGTGDDLLVGGEDADWLTGGSGSDDFLLAMAENWGAAHSSADNPDTIMDFSTTDDQIILEGSQLDPVALNYVAGTVGYDAGYETARTYAMSLLDGDKTYAFVTDGVNGYLFMEPWTNIPEYQNLGIILNGLTSVSDFEWKDVMVG